MEIELTLRLTTHTELWPPEVVVSDVLAILKAHFIEAGAVRWLTAEKFDGPMLAEQLERQEKGS